MSLRNVLALSLVTGVAIAGCTVTTSSDVGDGGGAGGATTTDASTGGAKATGGGGAKATGGTKATGGGGAKATGGGTSVKDAAVSDGHYTCDMADSDACTNCVARKCCDTWSACGDNSTCTDKEFPCIDKCLRAQAADGGVLDLAGCAGSCADSSSILAPETNDYIACIAEKGDSGTQNCSTECYGSEL